MQLLASEFNSSSGASDLGSTVGLNTLSTEDMRAVNQQRVAPPTSCQVDMDGVDSEVTGDTLSVGTVTTCSSSVTIRDCDDGLSHGRGSFSEISQDGSSVHRTYRTPSCGSRGSSRDRSPPERKTTGHKKPCHCHCRGHDSRRLAHKRTRNRPCGNGGESKAGSSRIRHRAVCACSLTDVQLNEICVKNRNAKESGTPCDSHENESLLGSEAHSPLLCDVDDDDITSCDGRGAYGNDITSCDGRGAYGNDLPPILTTDVQCLVHENAFCDTVC